MILGSFWACNGIGVSDVKWLKSACSVLIWGLYGGIGQQAQGCMPVGLHYIFRTLFC